MNCNKRANNMSKRKLTDYFKPGNSKNVRKDVDSTVQNEPIIETTTLQDQEVVAIEEGKQFHPSDDFCFPKKKMKKDNILVTPLVLTIRMVVLA